MIWENTSKNSTGEDKKISGQPSIVYLLESRSDFCSYHPRKNWSARKLVSLLEISLCVFLFEIRCTIRIFAESEKVGQTWRNLQIKISGQLPARELHRSRSDFWLLFSGKNWSVHKLTKNVAISIKKNSTTKSMSVRHPRFQLERSSRLSEADFPSLDCVQSVHA